MAATFVAPATPMQEDWRQMLSGWRESDVIDVEQETVLTRYFNERESGLQSEMQQVSEEYARRMADAGEEAAKEWLVAAAAEMGRRDREEIDRMLASMGIELPRAA